MSDQMIPAKFWQTITLDEFKKIGDQNGCLNAEQCARLWRLTDRQGDPPQRLEVFFDAEEIEAAFPVRKRAK